MVGVAALLNLRNTCIAGSNTHCDSSLLLEVLLPDRKHDLNG